MTPIDIKDNLTDGAAVIIASAADRIVDPVVQMSSTRRTPFPSISSGDLNMKRPDVLASRSSFDRAVWVRWERTARRL